jgi:hypothetical protein
LGAKICCKKHYPSNPGFENLLKRDENSIEGLALKMEFLAI